MEADGAAWPRRSPPQRDSKGRRVVRIAVEGCGHGELDAIFEAVTHAERVEGVTIDMVLCCGDFQAVRNEQDLETMQCPLKYRAMNSFFRYYSGERRAPRPVVFIGGNHEASNHMQEIPLGGWAAPGVYYLGGSGVVRFRGLRIGGLSGIYKSHDFWRPHTERPPYARGSMSSVYHQRALDAAMLLSLAPPGPAGGAAPAGRRLDVCASHDWPLCAVSRGRWRSLKPHFMSDIHRGDLGSPAASLLLRRLAPSFWFSAHLHCRYAAVLPHPLEARAPASSHGGGALAAEQEAEAARIRRQEAARGEPPSAGDGDGAACGPVTRFLALDKPIRGRSFLHVVEVPIPDDVGDDEAELQELCFDPEWCAVLRKAMAGAVRPPEVARDALDAPPFAVSADEVEGAEASLRGAFGGGTWAPAPKGAAGSEEAASSSSSSSSGPVPIPPRCPQPVPPFFCPPGYDPSPAGGHSCDGVQVPGLGLRTFRTPHGYPGPRMPQPPLRGSPLTDALAGALGIGTAALNTVPFAGAVTLEEYEAIRAGRGGVTHHGGAAAAPVTARSAMVPTSVVKRAADSAGVAAASFEADENEMDLDASPPSKRATLEPKGGGRAPLSASLPPPSVTRTSLASMLPAPRAAAESTGAASAAPAEDPNEMEID